MKLKLVAAISALAIPALAHAQQSFRQRYRSQPRRMLKTSSRSTSDKVKTKTYCALSKLFDQIQAAEEKNR